MAKFALELNADKTRLIEFGRFAGQRVASAARKLQARDRVQLVVPPTASA